MATLHVAPTDALSSSFLRDLRAMLDAAFLDAAFEEPFTDDDWQHALGGVHVWVSEANQIISHGSIVERTLLCAGTPLPVGYVEALATVSARRRQGHGAAVMRRMGELIRERYDLGALSTGVHAFYERLGWERWRGPTFVAGADGLERTPDDDDSIMICGRGGRQPSIWTRRLSVTGGPERCGRTCRRRITMGRIAKQALFGAVFTLAVVQTALAQEGTLLVANRTGGSISLIDLPTRVEIARLPIGPIIPHEVAVSPDGRRALTAEYGPESRHGQHVVLIDIPEARIVGRIDLGPKSRPHSALFHPDGRHAVATMQNSDQIAVIDLEAMKVVRTRPTGGREGHMVRLSPDGSRAYVTSRGAEGTLSVIYLNEDRPPVVIRTGRGAEGLAVTPDGREVWVANRHEETISVVDTTSLTIVATLPSRLAAGRIEMGANGLAVVPNGGAGRTVPQYLRLFDVKTRKMVAEVPLRDGKPHESNWGVMIRGDLAFVSDPDVTSTIRVFNLRALETSAPEVLATVAAPDGLAWSPLRVGVLR